MAKEYTFNYQTYTEYCEDDMGPGIITISTIEELESIWRELRGQSLNKDGPGNFDDLIVDFNDNFILLHDFYIE